MAKVESKSKVLSKKTRVVAVRDLRGVPAGTGQVVAAPNQSAVFTTQASTKTYPACSKTVTDGCVQAYERGRK